MEIIKYLILILVISFGGSVLSAGKYDYIHCKASKIVHCTVESSCVSVNQGGQGIDDISLTFFITKRSVIFQSGDQQPRTIAINKILTDNDQLALSGQNEPDDKASIIDYWTAVFTDNNKRVTISVSRGAIAAVIFGECSSGKKK